MSVLSVIKTSLRALRKGEFLLRIKAHERILHILYLFLLAWIVIFINLKVDATLTRMQENKITLRNLEISKAQKEAELVNHHSASSTAERLKAMGSNVQEPVKPAARIQR